MIPIGYMGKIIKDSDEIISNKKVDSIYSVSNCISKNFIDYIKYWKHNQFWFFDSFKIIKKILIEENLNHLNIEYLFYEVFEKEFYENLDQWKLIYFENNIINNVNIPKNKIELGYDIVTYSNGDLPGCSPLSCNGLAIDINANKHCLIDTLEETIQIVENLKLLKSEPGPFRIIKVSKIEKSF